MHAKVSAVLNHKVPHSFGSWTCLCKFLCPCPEMAIDISVSSGWADYLNIAPWWYFKRLMAGRACAKNVHKPLCQCPELAIHTPGAEQCEDVFWKPAASVCCQYLAFGTKLAALNQVPWLESATKVCASSADPSHCFCQYFETLGSRRLVFFTQATREVCAASLLSFLFVHASTSFCFNQAGM